jgi:hypothetical protein
MNPKPSSSGHCCPRSFLLSVSIALLVWGRPQPAAAATVVYDTTPYWTNAHAIIGGLGPGQSSTQAETFIAPSGASVSLNDFSFVAQSYYPYGGLAHLQLRAFVFAWSGSLTGKGGGAVGSPLYLSPSVAFSPPAGPSGWVPLTASLGQAGLTLTPGGQYVMGFTLSMPADYAASQGDIEFQLVPNRNPSYPSLPAGVDGYGGAVWLNNGNDFALLNTAPWSTWGDTGDLAFTAHFAVVPEPTPMVLVTLGGACWAGRRYRARRWC